MKKLLKVLAVLAGIVVVLLLAASILLRIYLPPEKAKALVLQRLSMQLKREVDVGSVSVGILSGLQMSKLRISESPNFTKGTFISSELFSLKISLPPLLLRKVIIRQMLLKRPDVSVIRNADGLTFNFSDLTASAKPAAPDNGSSSKTAPSSGDGMPFLLIVSRAEIQKGALHFVDRSPGLQSADISDLNVVLKGVSLTTPFSAQTSMRVKTQGQTLDIHLAGQTDIKAGSFKIASGGIDVGPVKTTITGSLNGLQSPNPSCKIHVETNKIPVRDALKTFQVALPEGVHVDGTTQVAADVSGTASNAQFAAKWTGTDMLVARGDDFVKPTGTPLEASIIGSRPTPNDVLIRSLNVKLGANTITGSGALRTSGKVTTLDFDAKGTQWSVEDLAKLSPAAGPFHPSGSLSFGLHATGPSTDPRVSVATLGNVALKNFKQQYIEGDNLDLNWNLTDITPDLAKVNGTAALKGGRGKILNVDELAATSRIGKIALAPLQALSKIQAKGLLKEVNLPSLKSIPFDSLAGDYAIKSGMMTIKTFSLNGKDLSIDDVGTVGLAGAQPLNMKVAMKLAVGSVGGTVGEMLNDSSGRPTVKFTATGTVNDPKVKLDLQEVKEKAAEQIKKELLKNKDVQNAVDGLQKSLKGLFH